MGTYAVVALWRGGSQRRRCDDHQRMVWATEALSLSRRFKLAERLGAFLRVQAFNVLNWENPNPADLGADSPKIFSAKAPSRCKCCSSLTF